MIISKTPLRVSFAGGGTDIADYYRTGHGAVVSSAIKKYVYVTVNKRFDDDIRISYSKTEIVDSLDKVEHGLVREALRKVGIRNGIEITTIADIPSKGTGLGSSSAIAVGLLNALYAFKGYRASPKKLAEEACEIEIEKLGEPIGKQDQYIAAYGGIQHIKFNADETVTLDPVICPPKTKRDIESHLMLIYTGKTRKASDILSKQKSNSKTNKEILDKMRDQAEQLFHDLTSLQVNKLGQALKDGWELKKSLAKGISDPEIDKIYAKALKAGAVGGKITGAGGGGFLVLFVPPESHWSVRNALTGMKDLEFKVEPQGSKIIYVGDDY
ncbi:MAG: GHMP kinase [Candidatus Thermoplasmatota archaeon]|nr:GHMP kinase [Candidatus Thermoplasmatota archaeon]